MKEDVSLIHGKSVLAFFRVLILCMRVGEEYLSEVLIKQLKFHSHISLNLRNKFLKSRKMSPMLSRRSNQVRKNAVGCINHGLGA